VTQWERARREVESCIAERPSEYELATVAVMNDILELLRRTGRQAPNIWPGYWPTFCVDWDLPGAENLKLEVFDDRVEVYRYNETLFDVWDEKHAPGSAFSEAFLNELPAPDGAPA